MTSKTFDPREIRRAASTRRAEATAGALRQALHEMGFGRAAAAAGAAAWQDSGLDPRAADRSRPPASR
jgi:hypothetical protein